MTANQYRSQLERKRDQRVDAERRAGTYRGHEADHRTAVARAVDAATRASSPSTKGMRVREATRRDRQANDAAKEAARWQKRAADYAKEEATLQRRLASEEQRERDALERQYKREREASHRAAAAESAHILSRLEATETLVTTHLRAAKPERLRILMLGASSEGDLRVGREQTRIRRAVESAQHRDLVEFDVHASATTADLLDGLSRFRPHVVHFSGHSSEDLLVFEDEIDIRHIGVAVSADAFAHAVAAPDDAPMLVVLNSCKSAAQAQRLAGAVAPFAIGMPDEIADADAISYAARFYSAIADGQSILAAHTLATVALEFAGLAPNELPTLASADGVDPAQAILVLPPE